MMRRRFGLGALVLTLAIGASAGATDDATETDPGLIRLPVGPDTTVVFTIHDSLPPFRFTLIHDAELGAVVRIDVRRDDGSEPAQVLEEFPEAEPAPGGQDDVSVEDIDFDGYADLKLLALWGATGSQAYHYWRYDPGTGRFAYDDSLSALGNPTPDPAARVIRTRVNGGMEGQVYTEGTYRWIQGRLEIVRRETQDWDPARNAFTRRIEERRGGLLVSVRRGLRFEGEVTDGERFTFDLTDRLYFELDPDPDGWEIAVRDAARPGENLARLTPPLHGPNPRLIWGWNFAPARDPASPGGGLNAPGREREFIFSEKVGRTIQGPSSDRGPTAEEIEEVGRDGTGLLTIEDLKLNPAGPAGRPQLQWMRFTATVDYP